MVLYQKEDCGDGNHLISGLECVRCGKFVAPPMTDTPNMQLTDALKRAIAVADEAREEWDKAPAGMRAGKILIALSGHAPGYRADIDEIHAALHAQHQAERATDDAELLEQISRAFCKIDRVDPDADWRDSGSAMLSIAVENPAYWASYPYLKKAKTALELITAARVSRPAPSAPALLGSYGPNNEGLPDISSGWHIFADGNMWCAVGPAFEDLQASPAGFGPTPRAAYEELMRDLKGTDVLDLLNKPSLADFKIHQPTVKPNA